MTREKRFYVVETGSDGLFDPEITDGQGEDESAVGAQEHPDFIQTLTASGLTQKFTWFKINNCDIEI